MIEQLLQWTLLLSDSSPGQNVWGRFDHQRPTYDLGQILLVIAAALVVAAAGLVLMRLRGRFRTNSTPALFREFCRAHGLGQSGRRLLKRLAAARGLPNPLPLFVEPRHFDVNDLPQGLQPARTELQSLRDQLFK
jgi:hypothetical protein